eukprot:460409_1
MSTFSNKIMVFVIWLSITTSVLLAINCDYFEYSYDTPAIPCNLCLMVQKIETNETYSYKYECNNSNNTVYINTYMDNKCNIISTTQSLNAYIYNNNNNNNICEYK